MGCTASFAWQNASEAPRWSLTLGAAVGVRLYAGRHSQNEICCVSQGSDPPSIHARFGDGLDGRRQIGRNPAEGGVGSADAPRGLRQPPPTYEPDEARGSVLGERTLSFLAGE